MLLALFEGDRLDDERVDPYTYMNRLLSAHPAAIECGLQRDPTRWGAPHSPPTAPSAGAAAAAAAAHAGRGLRAGARRVDADAVDPHSSASAPVGTQALGSNASAPQAAPTPIPLPMRERVRHARRPAQPPPRVAGRLAQVRDPSAMGS